MHLSPHRSIRADKRWLRPLVFLLGGFCLLLGAVVMIGWPLHSTTLIQLRPTLAPMLFNTALCILLSGAALALWAWGRFPRTVSIFGGIIAAFGILTLAEYLFRINLGIDQLLFRCYVTAQTSNPGRMSPASSFCFALSGFAFLSLGLQFLRRWRSAIVGSMASIVISIAVVALIGYALGLPGAYGWAQLTRIALHTAAGFCLIGAGLFIIGWRIAIHPGERTPRWLPFSMALAVFTGSVILYFALVTKQSQETAEVVASGAEGAESQIAIRMDARVRSLERLVSDWKISGPPAQAAWEAISTTYVRDLPDMQAIQWIDASHTIRWVAPLAGNESTLNKPVIDERRKAALDQAALDQKPVISSIVRLPGGEIGFAIYVPIVANGQPDGFLGAIFKAAPFLDRILPPAVADGEAITVSEKGVSFFQRDVGTSPVHVASMDQRIIKLRGVDWVLRIWPAPALASRLDSPLPAVALCAGALCALLVSSVSYYAQRSSRQANETARTNAALQAALDQVKTLEGLLPICMYCKRVRDDTGYWTQIDTYLRKHTKASLSHGYCPECAAKFYEECGFEVPENIKAEIAAGNYE